MLRTISKARPAPAEDERLHRRLEREVERYCAREGLWPPDGRVLVAVSGGPDSTALLLVLAALAPKHQLELTLAYFDHQLRGQAAALSERQAVEALAARAGCELVAGAGDVRGTARAKKLSLEEAARRARYNFLAAVAEERGIGTVAVGHTADDQAETVLMHMIRGSGLTGIAGMSPKSRWPSVGHEGLAVVRPLLHVSHAETVAYCRSLGIQPVEDESNAARAFVRNRVRAELLPALKGYNPAVVTALGRLADATRADLGVVEDLAGAALLAVTENTEVSIDRAKLREMAPALRRHGVRLALLRLVGDLQGFGEKHIDAVVAAAIGRGGGAKLDLPRGVCAGVTKAALVLRFAAAQPRTPATFEGITLAIPGSVRTGALWAQAGRTPLQEAEAWVEVDAEATGGAIEVRPWRAGDRMQPAGMLGTKKLQDLFVDAGVPREQRRAIPIFEAERGIVWVAGLRIADWARPREDRPTVVLSFRKQVAR